MKKVLLSLSILSVCLAGCTDNGSLLRSSGKNYVSLEPSGVYKIGTPYQVNNIWYYPQEDYDYREVGIASWYGPDFHNGMTANGEKYDMYALTAAHRTLPLPSIVKVTNLENGKSVVVRVNDRGPFVNNRIIDVSKTAAEILGFDAQGTAKVRVEVMKDESKKLKKEILKNGGKVVGGPPLPDVPPIETAQEPVSPIPLANPVMAERVSSSTIEELETTETTVSQPQPIYTPQTTSVGNYYVQAGAFSNPENAQRMRERLASYGSVVVSEKQTAKGVLYRVRLGPYANGDDAVAAMDRLGAAGFDDTRLIQEMSR